MLLALVEGLFDDVAVEVMEEAERAVRDSAANLAQALRERLVRGGDLDTADRAVILAQAGNALAAYRPEAPPP